MQPVSAEWISAASTPEAGLTPHQREVPTISDELVVELQAATEYVLGVSMHNFSIPAVLELWIDEVARIGKTVHHETCPPTRLLRQKNATFLVASGGGYDQGTPMAVMNFAEPCLRSVFGFIGVTDISFINAGGTDKLRYGVDRETILRPPLASIRAQLQLSRILRGADGNCRGRCRESARHWTAISSPDFLAHRFWLPMHSPGLRYVPCRRPVCANFTLALKMLSSRA